MASDLGESVSLDAKPNERELDAQRLNLESPRASLIDTDPFLLGMRMGNILYAAAFGLLKRIER
jgi:hypothetical protein